MELKTTEKPFAIQVMETRMREGREVCSLSYLSYGGVSHRSIIQLLEIFGAQDRVYMVVGLGPEREFFDWLISQGSFIEQDAVRIPHVVADGMRYVHASKITQQGPKA